MFKKIFSNFFTHKDFLPPPEEWQGTLFSPLQIIFSMTVLAFIIFSAIRCSKKGEAYIKRVFLVIWIIMLINEPSIILWETFSGKAVQFELNNMLPLWPCSIFLYTAPFAIFGKGKVRAAACGFICTLGLFGGAINFVYPATYLSRYSCLSIAGFYTIYYHGSMIFTALTMLLSGYHSFKGVTEWKQLLLPVIPMLIISIPANIINFTLGGTDYMFFKLESFFFAPIGAATPDWLSMILVYILYAIIHIAPYLPSFIAHKRGAEEEVLEEYEVSEEELREALQA